LELCSNAFVAEKCPIIQLTVQGRLSQYHSDNQVMQKKNLSQEINNATEERM